MINFNLRGSSIVAGVLVASLSNGGAAFASFEWFTAIENGYYQTSRISDNEASFDRLYGLTDNQGLFTAAQLGARQANSSAQVKTVAEFLFADGIYSNPNPVAENASLAAAAITAPYRNELRDSLTPPFIASISSLSNSQALLTSLFSYETNHPDFEVFDLGFGFSDSRSSSFSDFLLDGNIKILTVVGGTVNPLAPFLNQASSQAKTAQHLYELGIYSGLKIAYNLVLSELFDFRIGTFVGYSTAHLGGVFKADGAKLDSASRYASLLDPERTHGSIFQIGAFNGTSLNLATSFGSFLVDFEALLDWFQVKSHRVSGVHGGKYKICFDWNKNDLLGAELSATVSCKTKLERSTPVGATLGNFYSTRDTFRTDELVVSLPDQLNAQSSSVHVGLNLEFTYLSLPILRESLTLNTGLKVALDYFHFPSLSERIPGDVNSKYWNFFDLLGTTPKTVPQITSNELLNQALGADAETTIADLYQGLANYLGSLSALRSNSENILRLNLNAHFGAQLDVAVLNQSFIPTPFTFDASFFIGYRYSPEITHRYRPVLQLAGEDAVASFLPKQDATVTYGGSSFIVGGVSFGAALVTEVATLKLNYLLSLTPSGTVQTGSFRFVYSFR